ncbi:MAG TPA: hypothetical protein DDW62_10765 [Marinilabiliaceae bacterium]|nr:hypothetical protein [Marinilabiliaceae bacterium]
MLMRALLLVCLYFFLSVSAFAGSERFFTVLSQGSRDDVEKLILDYEAKGDTGSQANIYRGALYARMAGLVNTPVQRLEYFKRGRLLIEAEIKQNANNIEYRFIRLIIQEQAPSIVRYRDNIDEDSAMIIAGYETLDDELKREIDRYAKTSKLLNIQ